MRQPCPQTKVVSAPFSQEYLLLFTWKFVLLQNLNNEEELWQNT